ncbi:hypothetical protein SELMODRAFT_432260 [Selaginella moellendorffii]|uniref:Uncharacterized protein n=1 Tax=Selaginella moellendorffii TaxID=88036 RepID=D8TFG6_SELML|nr:hypothetical protein SELMODRAFT_432260 [Selaginella moellendorffii]
MLFQDELYGILRVRPKWRRFGVSAAFSCAGVSFHATLHRSDALLTTDVHWYTQTLDHYATQDDGTFAHRYYEFTDYFDAQDALFDLAAFREYYQIKESAIKRRDINARFNIYDQKHLKENLATGDLSSDRYQVCTELAYFQAAPANNSIRSDLINVKYISTSGIILSHVLMLVQGGYHLDLRSNVFENGTFPEVDSTNLYYRGNKIPDVVHHSR